MQDHPNPHPSGGAPSPGSSEHRVQRWVLLELVTAPPPDGDEIGTIARSLGESRSEVEAAVRSLVEAGLAVSDGEAVRPSTAALRFEALWPART